MLNSASISSALSLGSSVVELTPDELMMVSGGAKTVVIVCQVENYNVTSCSPPVEKED